MSMADRISALPDSILCHILSFLSAEQAVATSVLSKRWKPLWLAIPTLNFDDESYLQNKDTYSRFLELVYTVMLLQGGEQPINRFCLKCASSFCDPSVVNTWVMAATQRKVEHLSLSLPRTISLSSSVFNSKTLVVLKLRGLTLNCLSSVSFPSLKILHLRLVRFQEKRYLVEILSACPVLEVLLMVFLEVTNFYRAHISELKHLPKLVKADICQSSLNLPLKPFYNVEFLCAEVVQPQKLPAHKLFNLTYMELRLLIHYYWDWLTKLLGYCPNLQSLVIEKCEDYFSNEENWVQPQFVPECLLSQLKRFCVRSYEGGDSELQFTRYVMCNARVLRKVTILSTYYSDPMEKLEMIKELSLCPRGSDTCELHFE